MMLVLKRIGDYLSLVKFAHTVFALPFALIGFSLAATVGGGTFSLKLLLLVILCMVTARNSAMGFNRLVDRHFDALNPRTSQREIPAGKVSATSAVIFVTVNSVLFIISAGLINRLTLLLSPVALAVILGYSLTKRFTWLCHFILGLGLSLAPIGAWLSVTGRFEILPLLFSGIVFTWVSGFDIIYALQDDEFDRSNKLHSIPSATGRRNAIIVSVAVHIITVALVIAAGIYGGGSYIYWIGAIVFIGLLIFQHIIVRPDDLSRVNLAFGTTNGIASLLYASFVIADALLL